MFQLRIGVLSTIISLEFANFCLNDFLRIQISRENYVFVNISRGKRGSVIVRESTLNIILSLFSR